jgi:transitional endoplasmic reticulum ATPase
MSTFSLHKMRRAATSTIDEVPPIVNLWVLRILIPLGRCKAFLDSHEYDQSSLGILMGLNDTDHQRHDKAESEVIRKRLQKLHVASELKKHNMKLPANLLENMSQLQKLVELSDTDCRILEFLVLKQSFTALGEACELFENISNTVLTRIIAIVLDISQAEVQSALRGDSALRRSGLLVLQPGNIDSIGSKCDLLSEGFSERLLEANADPVTLLRDSVALGIPATLSLSDFGHIAPSLSLLKPYLKAALLSGRKGVNIYLHGSPGTGKSQLAKVLAAELDSELFEVASEDEDGDSVKGERRLSAYRVAQSFFSSRKCMLVFDEAEDVFDDGDSMFGRKSTAQTRKAWINRMLEGNPVPTIWLSNGVRCMDTAFIRRFDMVFELPIPPKKQRARIIEAACNGLLNTSAVERIAEVEMLAPAVVTKAADVMQTIRQELAQPGHMGATNAMELLISNTLEAQGHKPIRRNDPNRLPETYDPSFIHANTDLAIVSAGLLQAKSGRLCLYGPPGTGKTAYGRWLANELGTELMVKRASDLSSKWVGESEKNIAQAFATAEREGSLLLIDEIDSFLQDRRTAQASWEVSQVNEMLTQMESFSGIFIASTNLMDGLDQAALRRFDLKVRFDFLKPDQAWKLLIRQCAMLGLAAPATHNRAQIDTLRKLTPGDFAAVARQHRFRPMKTTDCLVAALKAECTLKEGGVCTIGFV